MEENMSPATKLSRFVAAAIIAAAIGAPRPAPAAEPITIGFGMGLTGGLAAAGKSALLAMQIWQDDVNAKGGLLGRPVKLVFYDDQSNPATVPGIYTKLLDVDKVDFIVSGYGTNLIAPAMPVAISHNRLFLGLFGLAVNSEFHYPRYFSMLRAGPETLILGALLQGGDGRDAPAQDAGAARRRFGIPQKCLRRHSRYRQRRRHHNRLRQDLSARHTRFHTDCARDPGNQPRHGVCRLLSARFGRHAARRNRVRAQDAIFWRRHGRSAIHPVQAAVRPQA